MPEHAVQAVARARNRIGFPLARECRIDHIAQLGGIDVLGFGSDFDGIEKWPDGLAHPGDYPNLIALLRGHGYSEKNIEAIAGGNLWRLLKTADAKRGA